MRRRLYLTDAIILRNRSAVVTQRNARKKSDPDDRHGRTRHKNLTATRQTLPHRRTKRLAHAHIMIIRIIIISVEPSGSTADIPKRCVRRASPLRYSRIVCIGDRTSVPQPHSVAFSPAKTI